MARRSSKGPASAPGWAILLLLGLIVTIANAFSRFVQENWGAVRAVLIVSGITLVAFLLFKLFKRRPRDEVANNEIAVAASVQQVRRPSAQARREPSFRADQSRSRGTSAKWIRPGEPVEVQGIALSAGLFYLGEAAPGISTDHRSQYVINPNLPIAKAGADIEGSSMPYWPSYANIAPVARRAFLQWMADGRCDPCYGISHVFIFFYGLEHRLFKEGARDDGPALIAEVTRLLSLYGGNNSFHHYASEFLFAAHVFARIAMEPPRPTVQRDGSSEIADPVRLHIGKLLATTNILSADDALVWVLAIPDTHRRTPVVRCFDEFVALWRIRFAQKFPDGLRIRVPKKTLRLRYRAASGAFEVDLLDEAESYPDITTIRAPIDDLKALVQSCTDELDPYSRFIGRQPDRKTTLEAALLLPTDLQLSAEADPISRLSGRLAEMFGTRISASMQMRTLLQLADFDVSESGKLPTAASDQLSHLLDRIGFAIEPDRRYGGWAPQPDDEIVMFKADLGGPIDPDRSAYRAIKVQVEVAILAAAADGKPSDEEFESVKNTIRAGEGFSGIERARLLAYAVTLFKSPPKQERIMRGLNERSHTEREAIARTAVAVVSVDGRVDAAKVRFLEKLHKALRLPKQNVYSELHHAAVTVDEPVVISTERRVAGFAIPKPKEPVVTIDPRRLARVRRDTDAVSKLLTQIFADTANQDDAHPIAINGAKIRSPLDGLDIAHAQLVETIEVRGDIPRKEFEQRARDLKLLPDGALETINEWSFDRFEEPLLEDGDSVVLVVHLRNRLAELRETTL
jgi:tellurite resistance protein